MKLSTRSQVTLWLVSLLLAVGLAWIPLDAADDDGYTIRTGASEVRLAFAACDGQGHVIKTLASSDIAVADNGLIIRHFRSFRPASESPLELVILLDASDSVAAQIPAEIAEVRKFVKGATWGEWDRVSILAFGGLLPQLVCAHNCNEVGAGMKLSALRANGATPLYDALFQAAEMLKENHYAESRTAMILFSDGMDTISMHSVSDSLQAAQNLQSAIYCFNSRSNKFKPDQGDAILNYLATGTGGVSFPPGQNVTEVLRMVLEDLRGGYVLTYKPAERGTGRHSVYVLPTRNPRLHFRSRQGYDDHGNE